MISSDFHADNKALNDSRRSKEKKKYEYWRNWSPQFSMGALTTASIFPTNWWESALARHSLSLSLLLITLPAGHSFTVFVPLCRRLFISLFFFFFSHFFSFLTEALWVPTIDFRHGWNKSTTREQEGEMEKLIKASLQMKTKINAEVQKSKVREEVGGIEKRKIWMKYTVQVEQMAYYKNRMGIASGIRGWAYSDKSLVTVCQHTYSIVCTIANLPLPGLKLWIGYPSAQWT